MRIVTACNEGYYERMAGWLDSLAERSNIPYTLVKVGWDYPCGRQIDEVCLPRAQNYGAPSETESVQHGSFLHVVEGPKDEILIYCDGDMVLQRAFTDEELSRLESFGTETVSAGVNYPGETLIDELRLLRMKVSLDELRERFPGNLDGWQMLNVGVLAMRRQAWQRVYDAYMERWELVSQTMEHQARQQWLINYVIYTLGLDLRIMLYSMHTHGHFGMQPLVNFVGDHAYANGQQAAIRHHLEAVNYV